MPDMSPYVWIGAFALLLVLLGFVYLFGSGRRAPTERRRIRPVRRLIGLLLFTTGVFGALLAFSVYRYLQLFNDKPVAMIVLKQQAPQQFEATVTLNNHEVVGAAPSVMTHVVKGDAWMMDARVLRWQLPAALAGVPSLYRLERLSGRYDDISQERDGPRTVIELHESGTPDLWELKRRFARWLPFVDAQYGSATWMPMFDGASYVVLFNDRGGLLARPADGPTTEGLKTRNW